MFNIFILCTSQNLSRPIRLANPKTSRRTLLSIILAHPFLRQCPQESDSIFVLMCSIHILWREPFFLREWHSTKLISSTHPILFFLITNYGLKILVSFPWSPGRNLEGHDLIFGNGAWFGLEDIYWWPKWLLYLNITIIALELWEPMTGGARQWKS